MTEELDNTPSPAGDIPQETLPKPLPAPEETAGNSRLPLRRKIVETQSGRRRKQPLFWSRLTSMNCGNAP